MLEIIEYIINDYTLRNVALGSSVLGIVAGALGSFAFLRKESLMGDVVAHSALLGITGIFLLIYALTGIGTRSESLLMLGAVIAGLVAMVFVANITSSSRIKSDSAMGIMLAIFFGGGMFLLTMIQQSTMPNKAGLSGYIFGSAATISHQNVLTMSVLGLFAILVMLIFWKEFKIHTFDSEFARTNGFSIKLLDILILSMIVIAIVIGLQAVGVILMVAMIVAPASAARQWTNKLWVMVLLSAFIGMISGLSGALSSSLADNLPTGPMIVLVATAIFILSVLFSPGRGILSGLIRTYKKKRRIELSLVLADLYALNLNHNPDESPGHTAKVINTMNKVNYNVGKSLLFLEKQGFVRAINDDKWILTNEGKIRAEKIMTERGSLID
ncbi:MAG: metal ABC transporter permease [Candidatus Kapabacteria bacterium]|nr:metal ABC transporter permease [Candidatus Kapabacteria bacterium]